MKISCFRCSRKYDLPETDDVFRCECGGLIDLKELRALAQLVDEIEDKHDFEEIQRMADDICLRIVNGEYSEIDVNIAKEKLREKCSQYFPEKMYLFNMLYESRFRRLWEQFREGSGEMS